MAAIDKIRWMRLINELSFLHEEVELVESIIESSNADFQKYYEDFCKENNIDIDQLNSDHSEKIEGIYNDKDLTDLTNQNKNVETSCEFQQLIRIAENQDPDVDHNSNYEMTKDEKEMHDIFNKLFRALAVKLHPDKLSSSLTNRERDDMINMFNKAKTSLDQRKYFVLLDLAMKFNIKTPKNYKQQIRWMKKESEIMKEKVNLKKNSYSYAFSECESEHEKDSLVKAFITQLFGLVL